MICSTRMILWFLPSSLFGLDAFCKTLVAFHALFKKQTSYFIIVNCHTVLLLSNKFFAVQWKWSNIYKGLHCIEQSIILREQNFVNTWGTKNNLIKSKLQTTFNRLLCRMILSDFFFFPCFFPTFCSLLWKNTGGTCWCWESEDLGRSKSRCHYSLLVSKAHDYFWFDHVVNVLSSWENINWNFCQQNLCVLSWMQLASID